MGRPIIQKYIIDGQHRISVLKDNFASNLCQPDFNVTVTEIDVKSESDAIDYFNAINCAKPIQYEEDPVLIVNRYIHALIALFPGKSKAPLIRTITTHRPYIHVDRLRDVLLPIAKRLRTITVDEFGQRVSDENNRILRDLEIGLMTNTVRDSKIAERCVDLKFGLSYDPQMRWINTIIHV
jgi:hypothetical protein